MVSDKVTVISKAYGEECAYQWESTGADGYVITEAEKDDNGTEIILPRLKSHPVCLTAKGGLSIEMEKVLNSMPVDEKVQLLTIKK